MNTTIPFPPRYLALIGVVVAAAGMLLVARPMLLGNSAETASPPTTEVPRQPSARPTPPQPKIALLPGLPPKVANKLRYSKVLVVSLYQGSASADRAAVGAARLGARAVGAGFLKVNVLNERSARTLQSFVGTTSTPTVVVVRRPGRIVYRLEGAASSDPQLVAQAAHNAGAGR